MALTKEQVLQIRNKMRRRKLLEAMKAEKKKAKRELRNKRKRIEEKNPELRAKRLETNTPKTIESQRVYDESIGTEFYGDEFDSYFENRMPKVFITTSVGARKEARTFARWLEDILPSSKYYWRKPIFEMKRIAELCSKRDYTDLVVVNEWNNKANGVTFIHLPHGPSFYFSLTNIVFPERLIMSGRATEHVPELILNNFSTRLGMTVGRLFQALFPQQPDFKGRQVVTLHNQRDFIFFRRHRYEFKDGERVRLQELGPQFTLRLRRYQKGIREEIAWEYSNRMERDKHKFYL